jgi:hypothetical protein
MVVNKRRELNSELGYSLKGFSNSAGFEEKAVSKSVMNSIEVKLPRWRIFLRPIQLQKSPALSKSAMFS